jgi:hypothetical protein
MAAADPLVAKGIRQLRESGGSLPVVTVFGHANETGVLFAKLVQLVSRRLYEREVNTIVVRDESNVVFVFKTFNECSYIVIEKNSETVKVGHPPYSLVLYPSEVDKTFSPGKLLYNELAFEIVDTSFGF